MSVRPGTTTQWSFLCDCGTTILRQSINVIRGKIKSCGCLQRETRSSRQIGKGMIDIAGRRFGKLTAVGVHESDRRKWLFQCDCGRPHVARSCHVKAGKIQSCGCLDSKPLKHGHSMGKTSREYNSWQAMRFRCGNPNHAAYKNYGGRGIVVCDQWLNSFEAFLADMGHRPEGMTLDRIDTDGPYEPKNCKWSTWSEQQNNRRNTRKLPVKHDIG